MNRDKLNFIYMNILLLILYIGFIRMLFSISGLKFYADMVLMIVLLFFTLIAMIGIFNGARFGWKLMTALLGIILINIGLFYFIVPLSLTYVLTMASAIIGFVSASIKASPEPKAAEPPKPVKKKKKAKKKS